MLRLRRPSHHLWHQRPRHAVPRRGGTMAPVAQRTPPPTRTGPQRLRPSDGGSQKIADTYGMRECTIGPRSAPAAHTVTASECSSGSTTSLPHSPISLRSGTPGSTGTSRLPASLQVLKGSTGGYARSNTPTTPEWDLVRGLEPDVRSVRDTACLWVSTTWLPRIPSCVRSGIPPRTPSGRQHLCPRAQERTCGGCAATAHTSGLPLLFDAARPCQTGRDRRGVRSASGLRGVLRRPRMTCSLP